jgi:prepilin peptidase CpaA
VLSLVAAGTSDIARYEIPNSLSVALVAGFALLAAALPLPVIVDHVLVGLTVLGAMAALFAAGVCGGGDVKLLAATALWIGWVHLPEFLLLTALAGGVLALVLLASRRLVASRLLVATGARPRRLFAKASGVPYGVAIAAAGLSMVPQLVSALGTN